MKRIKLIVWVIFFSIKGFSQNPVQVDTSADLKGTLTQHFNGAEIVLAKVTHLPEFPGGKASWVEYLKKNINLSVPLINKAVSGTYHVLIRFTVGKDGILRNMGAESNAGYGMEAEVLRCMKQSPKWKPAQTANNEIVGYATRQLVIFKIKGTDIEIDVR